MKSQERKEKKNMSKTKRSFGADSDNGVNNKNNTLIHIRKSTYIQVV